MTSYTQNGADIEGDYRYLLWREWQSKGAGTALFIMLNPSTADARADDPTIRRCVSFAKGWGYNRLEVVNLFALRTSDPKVMKAHESPMGPRNAEVILDRANAAGVIVCAWGTHGTHLGQDEFLKSRLLPQHALHALHLTAQGHPGHPLYLPSDSNLIRLHR